MQFPSPLTFNAFDWLLVAILVWSTVMAFLRGIIRVLFSFAGLILGIALASWYYQALAQWLSRWIASRAVAEVAGYLI